MKNIFIILFTSAIALTCTKDRLITDPMQRLWDCNKAMNYDSTTLADQLIGSWQWSFLSNEGGAKKADRDIVVTFKQTGKYSVSENSIMITEGSWGLKPKDGDILGLTTIGSSEFLYGRILLCGDELLFNSSYLDGADHYFVRVH